VRCVRIFCKCSFFLPPPSSQVFTLIVRPCIPFLFCLVQQEVCVLQYDTALAADANHVLHVTDHTPLTSSTPLVPIPPPPPPPPTSITMLSVQPRKVTLTLFCYLALVLAIASVAQADVSNHQARDHAGLSRMLRKRADLGLGDLLGGTSGAASDPPKPNDPPPPAGGSSSVASAPSQESASESRPAASWSSSPPSASASASVSASEVSFASLPFFFLIHQ
jgi:hypothetical protein